MYLYPTGEKGEKKGEKNGGEERGGEGGGQGYKPGYPSCIPVTRKVQALKTFSHFLSLSLSQTQQCTHKPTQTLH